MAPIWVVAFAPSPTACVRAQARPMHEDMPRPPCQSLRQSCGTRMLAVNHLLLEHDHRAMQSTATYTEGWLELLKKTSRKPSRMPSLSRLSVDAQETANQLLRSIGSLRRLPPITCRSLGGR